MTERFYFQETEAEINAISQRRRIEELEAQLQEAEDKILDLRMELRNVSDEVVKRKNEMQLFSGESAKEEPVDPKGEIPEDHSNIMEPIVPYPSDSELESIAASAVNGAFNQRIQDHKWPDANKQRRQAFVSPLQNCFGDSSLASIIMGSAEPEPYRNGCTQRIRAFERQHPDVVLAKGKVDNRCILAIGGPKSEASEKNGEESTLTFPRASRMVTRKKLLQEKMKNKLQIRRKRKPQFARSKSSSGMSYSHQLVRCNQSSPFVANCNLANGDTEAGEAVPAELSSMDAKQDMQDDSTGMLEKQHNNTDPLMEGKILKGKRKRKVVRKRFHAASLWSVARRCRNSLIDANIKKDKGCVNVSKEEAEMGSLQCVDPLLLLSRGTEDSARVIHMPTIVNEQEFSNESQLVEQESDAAAVHGIPVIGLDPEEADGPVKNSDLKYAAIDHDTEGLTKAKDSRVLKYTFHRKRKKDLSSCPNEDTSPEKGNIRKLVMDTEDTAKRSKRSSMVNESSRDSRRLAQVARQVGSFCCPICFLESSFNT